MDPVTIVAAIGPLGKTVYSVVTTLCAFVNATPEIDESVRSFYDEVKGLSSAIDAIFLSLRSPWIQDIVKLDVSCELRSAINQSLESCKTTVQKLEDVLESVARNSHSSILSTGQIGWNMDEDATKTIRAQIHTHHINLSMSLVLIDLHASCRIPTTVTTDIQPRIDRLTELINQVRSDQKATQGEQQPPGSNEERLSCTTKQLKHVAKKVLSQSSLIAELVASGSNIRGGAFSLAYGEAFDSFEPTRIEGWIPPPRQNRSTIHDSGTDSSIHEAPIFRERRGSTGSWTIVSDQDDEDLSADSGSDDDHDIDMMRSFLTRGHEGFSQAKYKQAMENFKQALKLAKGMKSSKTKGLDLGHARTKLGLSCLYEGELDQSEHIFLDITKEQPDSNDISTYALDATYALARLYFRKGNIDAAESYCNKARVGQTLKFGKKHPLYYLTLRLLARIYEARGLPLDSSACTDLIPNLSALPADPPIMYSPEMSTDRARALLEAKYSNWGSTDFDYSSALWWAVEEGHEPVVEYLLTKGVPVKAASDGNTVLHAAASKGHNATVRTILAMKVNLLQVKDQDDWTPLHYAACRGHEATVRLLLAEGADITAAAKDGGTALHKVAWEGHETTVRLLLAKGANTTAADTEYGDTALHKAAHQGHEKILRLLLTEGADATSTNKIGDTALHEAASGGHEAVVRLLLAEGADVRAVCASGWTALHEAAYRGHEATVRLLLAKGADITAVTKDGSTALHKAAHQGHETILRLLLTEGADVTPTNKTRNTVLHEAASGGHEAVVRLLLAEGADVRAENACGWTSLHKAAYRGHEAIVRLLLAEGADIMAADTHDGDTALHKAAHRGHETTVRLLLTGGADITAITNCGDTALHEAASGGHEAVVRLLLAEGADVRAACASGWTALHEAASRGHEAVLRLLLAEGADVGAASRKGWTSLHEAACQGHETTVRILLTEGADITAIDKNERTALHQAAWNGYETVVWMLLAQGASLTAIDDDGDTALHLAAFSGHEAVLNVLLASGADFKARNFVGKVAKDYAAEEEENEATVKLLEDTEKE